MTNEQPVEWYSEPNNLIFKQWWDDDGRHKRLLTPEVVNALEADKRRLEAYVTQLESIKAIGRMVELGDGGG